MKRSCPPDLLTPAEAAAVLGVGSKYMARFSERQKLSSVRTLGGHRRFPREDVNRLAESRVTRAGGDT